MSLTFKLSKRDGLTRRITFRTRPSWPDLAQKIHQLFAIPVEKVGVAYIDGDGDEVTLSSQEELDDFYQSTFKTQPVKFTVQDFTVVSDDKALPQTPRSSNLRNTFGPSDVFVVDVQDDWQGISPGLFLPKENSIFPRSSTSSPHAYVETVDSASVVDSLLKPEEELLQSDKDVDYSTKSTSTLGINKGKGRAQEDDDSDGSNVSLLAEDPPCKPPIHVYDISPSQVSTSRPTSSQSHIPPPSNGTVTPIQAQSTPKVLAQSLSKDMPNAEGQIHTNEIPDPPLPSLASLSLSDDVANLLNNLTNVFSSHPELSEGLRNIVQNASTGRYWAVHRDAISSAANELVRSAVSTTRVAEEASGRRVAEALGSIARSIAQATGGHGASNSVAASAPVPPNSGAAQPPVPPNPGTPQRPVPPWMRSHAPQGWRGRGPYDFGRHGPHAAYGRSWAGPFFPGAFPPPPPPHVPPQDMRPRPQVPTPPGPPPPLPDTPLPQGPFHSNPYTGNPASTDVPPMPPPPFAVPPTYGHFLGGWDLDSGLEHEPWTETWESDHPFKPTPQEMRAHVEAAKLYYKTEKEKYRKEREERRKEKERSAAPKVNNHASEPPQPPASSSTRPAAPSDVEVTQIVSNARGDFPQLEMYSVPRRHSTFSGTPSHPPPQAERSIESPSDRAFNRITKRLADMGFTEKTYPSLPAKIKAAMPAQGAVNKEIEDNIVTTLLEEMLATSPRPPAESGSGIRNSEIPGAWQH